MNIDRGEVSFGARSRRARLGDYQCDGTDARYYTSSDASGMIPGTALISSGLAPDAVTGYPVEVQPDSTAIIPDNAAATLPSITVPPQTGTSVFDSFNCWVDHNPLLALGGLGFLFFILRGKKR